jgi:dimethylargininase
MPIAFTRAVSPRLADCELTHLDRMPIDAAKAAEQHDAYEAALRQAGFEIVRLPDLPDHPDSTFVEDTALLLDGHAIILRPGVASRASETESTAAGLADHFEVHRLTDGHVDGGDVLRIGKTLYVGLSTRTDAAGVAALRDIAREKGYDVIQAESGKCLHLKSGASFAGRDVSGAPTLLYNPACIDPSQFAGVEPLAVDADEKHAANAVRAGKHLILPAGNPKTASRLRDRGFNVIEVDVSELQKAEAGVTCMSLIAAEPRAMSARVMSRRKARI